MLSIIRTDSKSPDFKNLVAHLNLYLKKVDGKDHEFYMQYNGIENLNHVVLAYLNNVAVACGAFKPFDNSTAEIKRMFTDPNHRNKNVATMVLFELENWAMELGFNKLVLETGKRQIEAVKFYKKNDYTVIENFGPYQGVENSICFKKNLIHE